jgi:glucosamine--fructose-6-phosphate aminotransferase (isomerizing)
LSSVPGGTNLERQIRSQPDALEELLDSSVVKDQIRVTAEGLQRARRIWVVGTGTSQHAASLGAAMMQEAGRSAHAVSSMQFVRHAPIVGAQDAVIVITHTAETAYALAARALAFQAGLDVVMVTKKDGPFGDAIETVAKETSETYTVSYTTALLALAILAAEIGAETLAPDKLALVPGSVRNAIESSGTEEIPIPRRMITIFGAGAASVTAREGALKIRESSRFLAEGMDAEYLLHGSAVPLTPEDHLIALTTPDDDGFVEALAKAGEAEGIGVTRLAEPAPLPVLLTQIPLAVRLQLLALRIATSRGQDPDKVIVGHWDDPALWSLGKPN